jgi:type II secretory pathway pseudopilin PulG
MAPSNRATGEKTRDAETKGFSLIELLIVVAIIRSSLRLLFTSLRARIAANESAAERHSYYQHR